MSPLWEHVDCGTVYKGKVPPLNCDICVGLNGWRHAGPTPPTPRNPRKRKGLNWRLRRLVNRDGGRCVNCGTENHLTVDHIQPRSKGGTNAMSNLQILCQFCNQAKGNTWSPD